LQNVPRLAAASFTAFYCGIPGILQEGFEICKIIKKYDDNQRDNASNGSKLPPTLSVAFENTARLRTMSFASPDKD
jgi:hypothetical protein